MKIKTKEFIQHLSHEIEDEELAEQYLDDSLPLIGLIVMYFNGMEKSLDSLICETINDRGDSHGLIIIQKLQYSAKVDLFKRLCEELHGCFNAPVEGFSELVSALSEVGKLRNLVVHADWENTDHEGYTFVRMKTSKGILEQEYVQFSSQSLEKLLNQIFTVREQLSDYWERRGELMHNSGPQSELAHP